MDKIIHTGSLYRVLTRSTRGLFKYTVIQQVPLSLQVRSHQLAAGRTCTACLLAFHMTAGIQQPIHNTTHQAWTGIKATELNLPHRILWWQTYGYLPSHRASEIVCKYYYSLLNRYRQLTRHEPLHDSDWLVQKSSAEISAQIFSWNNITAPYLLVQMTS